MATARTVHQTMSSPEERVKGILAMPLLTCTVQGGFSTTSLLPHLDITTPAPEATFQSSSHVHVTVPLPLPGANEQVPWPQGFTTLVQGLVGTSQFVPEKKSPQSHLKKGWVSVSVQLPNEHKALLQSMPLLVRMPQSEHAPFTQTFTAHCAPEAKIAKPNLAGKSDTSNEKRETGTTPRDTLDGKREGRGLLPADISSSRRSGSRRAAAARW
ncbi:hypothetical protein Esti_005505 [Eimeria stiedai]